MYGTVNYAKTAALMVNDERLNVKRRYALACLNCLEDEARHLFDRMGEKRIRKYLHKVWDNYREMVYGDMIFYFSCTFNGDRDWLRTYFGFRNFRNKSLNIQLFEHAMARGTGAKCEYFYQKLSPRERVEVLKDSCGALRREFDHRDYPTSSWMFYWSLLNQEQREGMFRKYTSEMLKFLLPWPLQPLFSETARRGWQFMDEYSCTSLWNEMLSIIIGSDLSEYDCSQLFWQCWRLSSAEYKQYLTSDDSCLNGLLLTERGEFIRFFYNHASWHFLEDLVKNKYGYIRPVLLDESLISDAALMGFKEKAALKCLKDGDNEEKRLRSKYLSRLVDMVMEGRLLLREEDCRPI